MKGNDQPMNRAAGIILGLLVAMVLLLGGFAGGFAVAAFMPKAGAPAFGATGSAGGSQPATGSTAVQGGSSLNSLVDQIQGYINSEALVVPKQSELTSGTLNGMIGALHDPYAAYFDPTHFKAFSEQTQGAFGGIGVTLGENKKGEAYVVSVIKGTPADKAGMKAGDVFVSIDGTTQPKWTSDQVVKLVRGKEGTQVKISMRRVGSAKLVDFTMTREQIAVPNVMSEMIGTDVGYIRVYMFNAKAAEDIKKGIDELKAKGARGYVLDLRDNPGGLLSAGVDVTSLFVKGDTNNGIVVRVDERGKPEKTYSVTGNVATNAPLVVLINANSASASEIAAGALQDYGRATLVGVKSFGKGSVQTIEQLSNGGAIKLTTAHYLTPKKRVINHIGLTPDVVVKMVEAKQASKKTDTQLSEAVKILQGKIGK
jgi:carboxyl-terminal processing protease